MLEKLAKGFSGLVDRSMWGGGQQSRQSDQCDQSEIESLKEEVKALELIIGEMIVGRERRGIKTRLKTIAKGQLRYWKWRRTPQWLREVRSLVRYISTLKENDAMAAQQMLLPHVFEHPEGGGSSSISAVRVVGNEKN